MIEPTVRVTGVAEFSRALKQVDTELPKQMKAKMMGIAQAVAQDARGRMPRLRGKAQGSVRARASARGAAVAWGGTAAPYMPWLDFGGSTGRGHRPKVAGSGSIKRPWRGAPNGEGRYIYPAIRSKQKATMDAVDNAIVEVARSAGFQVRKGG